MPQFSNLVDIHRFAIHRIVIELEVPGMYYRSYRCAEINAAGPWNGMAYMEEPNLECPNTEFIPWVYYVQVTLMWASSSLPSIRPMVSLVAYTGALTSLSR